MERNYFDWLRMMLECKFSIINYICTANRLNMLSKEFHYVVKRWNRENLMTNNSLVQLKLLSDLLDWIDTDYCPHPWYRHKFVIVVYNRLSLEEEEEEILTKIFVLLEWPTWVKNTTKDESNFATADNGEIHYNCESFIVLSKFAQSFVSESSSTRSQAINRICKFSWYCQYITWQTSRYFAGNFPMMNANEGHISCVQI